jgi:hypothetical protein
MFRSPKEKTPGFYYAKVRIWQPILIDYRLVMMVGL